jgi:PIN domain nuclease of toxin-antitoxin system
VRHILESQPDDVGIAATTVWELAIKTACGKLPDIRIGGHATLSAMLRTQGFDLLPLDPATAEHAAGFPPLHADPFDRALVAVAQRTGRTLLTQDAIMARYGVAVQW